MSSNNKKEEKAVIIETESGETVTQLRPEGKGGDDRILSRLEQMNTDNNRNHAQMRGELGALNASVEAHRKATKDEAEALNAKVNKAAEHQAELAYSLGRQDIANELLGKDKDAKRDWSHKDFANKAIRVGHVEGAAVVMIVAGAITWGVRKYLSSTKETEEEVKVPELAAPTPSKK